VFDTITTICNQLIGLIKARRLGQRQLFADHIEPIFQQLTDIHEDYNSAVGEIVALIEDYTVQPETIHDTIIAKKHQLEHIRQLVFDLNEACLLSPYSKSAPRSPGNPRNVREAAFEFARAVQAYFEFTTGRLRPPMPGMTWYTGLTGLIEVLLEGETERDWCLKVANDVVRKLPENWKAVTSAYARVKSLCYKPA
jgi:hypothetical protein